MHFASEVVYVLLLAVYVYWRATCTQSCRYSYVLCVFLPLTHTPSLPPSLPPSFSLLLHSSFPPSPFLSPSFSSLAGTVVSMIRQQLSNVVPLRCGSVMGKETPQGGESWTIHYMHCYWVTLANYNALVCSELCLCMFMCQLRTCVL